MSTHAELAARLLKEAADFFRTVAQQNETTKIPMTANAAIYDQVSVLLTGNPTGETGGKKHADMAGGLLRDAAVFLREIGKKNEPLKDQMDESARVFENLGELVAQDPLGILE